MGGAAEAVSPGSGLDLGPHPAYHVNQEKRDQGGVGEHSKGLDLQGGVE